MSAAQEAIAAMLARQVERTKVELPELSLLRVDASGPSLLRVPVPAEIWSVAEDVGKRAADVLGDIVTQINEGRDGRARAIVLALGGGFLRGVAFRNHGWWLEARQGTAEMSEIASAALAGKIREQPGRVHVDMIHAVDVDGVTYSVQLRDGEPSATTLIMHPDDPAAGQATGYVLECLDRLLTGLVGVKLPARPQGW